MYRFHFLSGAKFQNFVIRNITLICNIIGSLYLNMHFYKLTFLIPVAFPLESPPGQTTVKSKSLLASRYFSASLILSRMGLMQSKSVHLRRNGQLTRLEGSEYQECMKMHRLQPFTLLKRAWQMALVTSSQPLWKKSDIFQNFLELLSTIIEDQTNLQKSKDLLHFFSQF